MLHWIRAKKRPSPVINTSEKWFEMNENFVICSEKSKLDIHTIYEYLSERSYWAKGRTLKTVQKSIDNSLCFGMYDQNNRLVGFGRVVTDYAVFAYILDVFILEEHRGTGLGKKLIDFIINFSELKDIKRWQLATADAHGLYKIYGFVGLAAPEKHMEKVDNAANHTIKADTKVRAE